MPRRTYIQMVIILWSESLEQYYKFLLNSPIQYTSNTQKSKKDNETIWEFD